MLVIHIISTEDTNDFTGIYDGIRNGKYLSCLGFVSTVGNWRAP